MANISNLNTSKLNLVASAWHFEEWERDARKEEDEPCKPAKLLGMYKENAAFAWDNQVCDVE